MTSFAPHGAPASLCCVLKLACSHSEWSRHQWKNKSELGRGGAACKQMKREKAHLGEAKGGSLCYDLRLAHTYTQEGETDGILQRIVKEFCCGPFCCYFILFLFFFYNLEQSSHRFMSPFWILLCWNGDAWLCGLASGQQTLAKNTSVTSQLYSSFIHSAVVRCQWPGCVKKQLGSTSWVFLHYLLTQWFYMVSLTITCGG